MKRYDYENYDNLGFDIIDNGRRIATATDRWHAEHIVDALNEKYDVVAPAVTVKNAA